jgi:hypothetical protein
VALCLDVHDLACITAALQCSKPTQGQPQHNSAAANTNIFTVSLSAASCHSQLKKLCEPIPVRHRAAHCSGEYP